MKYIFVVQRGRLEREAVVLVQSMVRHGAINPSDVIAFAPEAGANWTTDPRPDPETVAFLRKAGVTVRAIRNERFGSRYPIANKVYALCACADEPTIFLDTDVVFLAPAGPQLDSDAVFVQHAGAFPAADARGVWSALYTLFDLTGGDGRETVGAGSVEFPYYNAGAIGLLRPGAFGQVYLDTLLRLDDSELPALRGVRARNLDQVALPIAIVRAGLRARGFPRGFNTPHSVRHAEVWHYHHTARFVWEGRQRYGKRIEDLWSDPAVLPLLQRDPSFRYWTSEEGRARYESVCAAAGQPLAGQTLVDALRGNGPWHR